VRRSRPARPAPPPGRRAGFALLAVIWGVGVISLLVVSFMSSGRLRLQAAHNIASATQASLIAEGVVNLVILALLAERDQAATQAESAVAVYNGEPRYCVFEGAAIAVGVEDESGKIDINAAPPELLKATLTGFGLDMRAADAIATAIVVFRSAPTGPVGVPRAGTEAGDKPFPPKHALFQTVMELDQVNGVDASLFRDLIPFLTVHSHSPGVDARAAPPALFAALTGLPAAEVRALAEQPFPNALNRKDPRFPSNFNQQGDRGAFLVHVEALLATGQTASKDALVDLRPGLAGQRFAIREMRRGRSLYADRLRAMIARNGAGAPDC
jgi:general secretion pathway protein K